MDTAWKIRSNIRWHDGASFTSHDRALPARQRGLRQQRGRIDVTWQLPQLEMQYRQEVAHPRNGFLNAVVRQAFYHAIDRQTLTHVMTQGLARVADSWYPPAHPLRSQVEASIPQFPYGPGRVPGLLARAGWHRGPDGVPLNAQSGERFEVELWGLGD